MFLNVTCTDVTYAARSCDESRASAPSIQGRFKPHGEASFAAHAASRLWVMLSFQIMAYFAKVRELSPETQLVQQWGGSDESKGPVCQMTMNRRVRRRLAHLRRRGRVVRPKLRLSTAPKDAPNDKGLTVYQYIDKMIRTQKWSRVKIFNLGLKEKERLDEIFKFPGLQGCAASLHRAMMCNAPISPD